MVLHKIERARRAAERLSAAELRRLDAWIHELLAALEAREGAQVLEERRVGRKTYRLQRVRCGKAGCKCAKGQGHGPYWYAFWTAGGRTRSQYIGKSVPGRGAHR